jgi:CBS domain containing-hemolysin-like protein
MMPLCFPNEVVLSTSPDGSVDTEQRNFNCPTGAGVEGPTSGDVLIVALIGLLGGALAASVSIRHLRGTIAPYNVPAALAMLKVPLGAFTAILALVAVRGDFVPGLTALDSQEQILAYALVLGFAQQLFTRFLDQQVQTVLQGLPSKDTADDPPPRPPPSATRRDLKPDSH